MMRFNFCLGVLLSGLALAVLSLPADARPKVSTRYTYYEISASSANGLYQQMVRRGPHVSGRKAFAATTARTRHNGKLVAGRTCKIGRYTISINFTIKLPKLKRGLRLRGDVRRRWKKFSAFVKRHEERHRAIWIGCARDVERRVRKVRAPNCKLADAKAAAIIKQVRKACDRKHDAFDLAERGALKNHPLVRAARSVRRKRTKVVSVRALNRGSYNRRKLRRKRVTR